MSRSPLMKAPCRILCIIPEKRVLLLMIEILHDPIHTILITSNYHDSYNFGI